MPLQQVFSLTPKASYFYSGSGHKSRLYVRGVTFNPKYSQSYRYSFDKQHTSNELYFPAWSAGDPAADYTNWNALRRVPHVSMYYDLSVFEPHKEVALTFGFDAVSESRILIYTDAGLLDEEILHVGDNQLLIEVESTSFLNLNFIHVNVDGSSFGGNWFLRGIDGYIA